MKPLLDRVMRKVLLLLLVSAQLHFTSYLSFADPAPNGGDITKEDIRQLVKEKIKAVDQLKPYMADQIQRTINGERPKGSGGVNIQELISSHLEIFDKGTVASEIGNWLLASLIPGNDGGTCSGIKAVPEMWCKQCVASVPFIGCIEYLLTSARSYRWPTQGTEIAQRSYQSDFTVKQLFTTTKNYLYNRVDAPMVAALLPAPLKKLATVSFKQAADLTFQLEWLQTQLIFIAQRGSRGQKQSAGELSQSMADGIAHMKASEDVIETISRRSPSGEPDLLEPFKGARATDAKSAFQEYSYTKVPMLIPRALQELYATLDKTGHGLEAQGIGILVGAGGIEPIIPVPQPLFVHENLPPFLPMIDPVGLAYLQAQEIESQVVDQISFSDSRTRVADAGLSSIGRSGSDISGIVDGAAGQGAGTVIAGIGKKFKRTNGLSPLDSVSSDAAIPGWGGKFGTQFSSQVSWAAFFDPRFAGLMPSIVEHIKHPLGCDGPLVGKLYDKADFNSSEVTSVLNIMSALVPYIGGQYASQFNSIMKKAKAVPCMKFGLGQAVPPTTKTTSNQMASTLIKAVFDASHVPDLTAERDLLGHLKSSNFYNLKYGEDDDVIQVTALKLAAREEGISKLQGKNTKAASYFEAPQGCGIPERPAEVLKDVGNTSWPLDRNDFAVDWQRFAACSPGSTPLKPTDTIFGQPIGTIINTAASIVGIDFKIKEWTPRTG